MLRDGTETSDMKYVRGKGFTFSGIQLGGLLTIGIKLAFDLDSRGRR